MATESTRPNATDDDEPGKWEELVDEWNDCAKAAMDRAADRAKDNVRLARAGRYGLGAWLDDMRWFWAEVAENTSHLVDTVRDTTTSAPRRDAGDQR